MSEPVTIVDYGVGNIHSVCKTLMRAGVASVVSSSPDVVSCARRLILPGVGHFGKAMAQLRNRGLVAALDEAVIQRKSPILGICLGMQLMARHGSEGDTEGLGWFDGSVERFNVSDELRYKVPHMGWNEAMPAKASALLHNIDEVSEFYFLHSYHYVTETTEEVLMNTCYGYDFVSAVEKENIFGFQFHPEKSHDAGLQLLKNFAGI
jgi:glutamine amidotransferase